MILWDTILNKLKNNIDNEDRIDFQFIDISYPLKWINKYPQCFPRFVIEGQVRYYFNGDKMRYELWKI